MAWDLGNVCGALIGMKTDEGRSRFLRKLKEDKQLPDNFYQQAIQAFNSGEHVWDHLEDGRARTYCFDEWDEKNRVKFVYLLLKESGQHHKAVEYSLEHNITNEEERARLLWSAKDYEKSADLFIKIGEWHEACSVLRNGGLLKRALEVEEIIAAERREKPTNRYKDHVRSDYSNLGFHAKEAGLFEKAFHYYKEAGEASDAFDAISQVNPEADKVKIFKEVAEHAIKKGYHREAAVAYETIGMLDEALGHYQKSGFYEDVIRLARKTENHVILREWVRKHAEHLVNQDNPTSGFKLIEEAGLVDEFTELYQDYVIKDFNSRAPEYRDRCRLIIRRRGIVHNLGIRKGLEALVEKEEAAGRFDEDLAEHLCDVWLLETYKRINRVKLE